MPEELEDAFGDIIKKARTGLGYNPETIAHQTSISVDDIISMETYQLKPAPDQVKVLASALNLDEDKLLAAAGDSWHPEQRDLTGLEQMVIERIRVPLGVYGSNSYILGCKETKLAAVIDPGGAVDELARLLEEKGLSLSTVLITHGHSDHTGGLNYVLRRFPRIIIIVDHQERVHGPSVRHPEDGEEFSVGNLNLKAISTPGHTSGSTCYLVNGSVCFVGDTLFAGSVGGTHQNSESFRTELASISSKILSLPDDTILLPGHGPATTVGEEKEHNPFF